jgi:hypothetical protein
MTAGKVLESLQARQHVSRAIAGIANAAMHELISSCSARNAQSAVRNTALGPGTQPCAQRVVDLDQHGNLLSYGSTRARGGVYSRGAENRLVLAPQGAVARWSMLVSSSSALCMFIVIPYRIGPCMTHANPIFRRAGGKCRPPRVKRARVSAKATARTDTMNVISRQTAVVRHSPLAYRLGPTMPSQRAAEGRGRSNHRSGARFDATTMR